MAVIRYTIGYIKADKKEIKGKDCDVIKVKLQKDGADDKWEDILSFNKCYSAAAVCNAGDTVDVTREMKEVNGKKFFNIIGFTKVSGASESCETTSYSPKQTVIPSAKASYGKSDDTQTSICRQSSNTAAMNFVIGMLANGVYKKTSTPDMLFEEVKRFAKKFEEYVTLKGDYGLVDAALSSVTATEIGDDDGEQF